MVYIFRKKCSNYFVTRKPWVFLSSWIHFWQSSKKKTQGKLPPNKVQITSILISISEFSKGKGAFSPICQIIREFLFILELRYNTFETYERVLFKLHSFFIFHYSDKKSSFLRKTLIVYLDAKYWKQICPD